MASAGTCFFFELFLSKIIKKKKKLPQDFGPDILADTRHISFFFICDVSLTCLSASHKIGFASITVY
jgi:hypothetical protein